MKNITCKKILIVLFPLLLIILAATMIDTYYKCNFTGIVTSKEIEEIPGSWIVWKNYKIEVDAWFGEKTYLIEQGDIYDQIKIGEEYSFKKISPFLSYVEIE